MAKRNHDGFENRSIIGILLSPFHAVRDSISESLSADKRYSDGESSTVVKVLLFPLKLVWGFLVFMVQAWTTSRNGLAFLRGFPAFAILAGTPIMIWGFINYQNAISLGPTSGYRKMHLSNESYDYAAMFAKKMVELKPESKQFKFYLANDLSRAGDPETEPVTRAANEDQTGRIMSFIAGSTELAVPPPMTLPPHSPGTWMEARRNQKMLMKRSKRKIPKNLKSSPTPTFGLPRNS